MTYVIESSQYTIYHEDGIFAPEKLPRIGVDYTDLICGFRVRRKSNIENAGAHSGAPGCVHTGIILSTRQQVTHAV